MNRDQLVFLPMAEQFRFRNPEPKPIPISESEVPLPAAYDCVWFWKTRPTDVQLRPVPRKGQRCRIIVRGIPGTVSWRTALVEFSDGFRVTCDIRAVRRWKPGMAAGGNQG